ncbi:hypothetical protein PHMEG_0004287 [Phytophthora megakarya]|uniref:Uncharacterized protein n=1 Tax=Phytophthora megakarya TaxID=4795 RepID=A0A225WU44_9STRA|nr:hypothetical protein PHMEG_0004287 [Phytophthora megakarya]
MQFMLYLCLAVLIISSATGDNFSGEIKFYRDINYRYNLALFAFGKSNRCFNLACGDYNDAVSSVKWSGLPGSSTNVVFYVDTGCTGKSKTYSTSLNGVKNFVDEGINDAISSFMVTQSSEKIENGETSLPKTGNFNDKSRIAIFIGKDCTGDSHDWPTDGVINDMKDNYPMTSDNKKLTNGKETPCMWG